MPNYGKKKKIKVLVLIDAWFPHVGGGQVHVWELAKRLVKKGYSIKIVTRDLGDWNNEVGGIEVVKLGGRKEFSNFFGRIEYLVKALAFCLQEDFDILHAHAFSPGLLVPIIKFFKKKPAIFTVHGKGVKVAGIKYDLNLLQDLIFYKIPYDLQITVAKNTLTKKSSAKRLLVIPNGVEIRKFESAQRKRKVVKNLVFVGRLSDEKGVDMLIKAFKNLGDKSLRLTIVGDGPELKALKNMSKKDNITFTGRLEGERLLDVFRVADLCVLPSRTEGQPVVLFEAWAAKLPIVVTDVGDNAFYVKDSVNGFIAEPNVKSLKGAIQRAIGSKDLVGISDRAYTSVKKYNWDIIATKTHKAYLEVLNET